MYVSGVTTGVVMTLPTDPEKAKKTAWKMVPNSGYPFIYNRKTNKLCLENKAWTVPEQIRGRKDTFPNHRGNFGRVVTTQGLWMMGGLVLPQADIPGHNNNAWWNVPGCAHQARVRD